VYVFVSTGDQGHSFMYEVLWLHSLLHSAAKAKEGLSSTTDAKTWYETWHVDYGTTHVDWAGVTTYIAQLTIALALHSN